MTEEQFKNAQSIIRDALKELPDSRTNIPDLEEKEKYFMQVCSDLGSITVEIEDEMNEFKAISKAVYRGALLEDNPGKNNPEREAHAKADEEFCRTELFASKLKSRAAFVKLHIDIFKDAYITCRQRSKE